MINDNSHEKALKEATKLHKEGLDGDQSAVKSAYEKLMKLRTLVPNNGLIEAYFGSTLVLLARDATKLMEKEEKALEGLDALNRAVELEPNHKEVRFLRANVCLRLPEVYFHCAATAIEDFSYLLDRYQESSNYLTYNQVCKTMRNLSTAYVNAGNPDQANNVIQQLAQFKKNARED
jgi:hypothetical protein